MRLPLMTPDETRNEFCVAEVEGEAGGAGRAAAEGEGCEAALAVRRGVAGCELAGLDGGADFGAAGTSAAEAGLFGRVAPVDSPVERGTDGEC